MGSRIPASDTEPQGRDRGNSNDFWPGRRESVQAASSLRAASELASSVPSPPTAFSLSGSGWDPHQLQGVGLEQEDGATMASSSGAIGRISAHGSGSSITLSSLSVQSAPAREARINSSGSIESAAVASLSERLRDQISTVTMGAPSARSSAPKRPPGRKWGPFEVPEEKFAELVTYRRSLALLALAFIYTLFAFAMMLFKSPSHTLSGPASVPSSFDSSSDWSQEQIVGWHREQSLVLSREFLQHKTAPINIRVRDCKSYAAYNMQQYSTSLLAGRLSAQPAANSTSTTTTRRPSARPKRQFAALNGCMFRRDASSDSLGDLCCCSGIPKFKTTNSTGSNSSSPRPAVGPPTTKRARKLGGAMSTTARPKREYLRPHLMCFISASGSLFNSQKLVAPLANEYNLRNAHIADKGKCIPCSCCHEHEPEMVNKLLANVPVSVATKPNQHEMSAGFESVAGSRTNAEASTGFWVSIRKRLVDSMRSLDEFLFYLYDMLDLTSFTLRHGAYPIDNLPANSVPFIGRQFDATVPHSRFAADQAESDPLVKDLSKSANSLLIDGDTYDDFTTTTTTTTTTSTTKEPSTKRAKRKRKRPRVKPTGEKSEKSEKNGTLSAKADGGQPKVTVFIGKTRVPEAEERAAGRNESLKRTSTTTKSPTFIINVYAGAHGPADGNLKPAASNNSTSRRPTGPAALAEDHANKPTTKLPASTSSTSSSRAPSITLVAVPPESHSAPSGTNIRLQIELAGPASSNSSARLTTSSTTTTRVPVSAGSPAPMSVIKPAGEQLAIAISSSVNLPPPEAPLSSGETIIRTNPSFSSSKTVNTTTTTTNTSGGQDQRIVLIWPGSQQSKQSAATSEAPRRLPLLEGARISVLPSQQPLLLNGGALLQQASGPLPQVAQLNATSALVA